MKEKRRRVGPFAENKYEFDGYLHPLHTPPLVLGRASGVTTAEAVAGSAARNLKCGKECTGLEHLSQPVHSAPPTPRVKALLGGVPLPWGRSAAPTPALWASSGPPSVFRKLSPWSSALLRSTMCPLLRSSLGCSRGSSAPDAHRRHLQRRCP